MTVGELKSFLATIPDERQVAFNVFGSLYATHNDRVSQGRVQACLAEGYGRQSLFVIGQFKSNYEKGCNTSFCQPNYKVQEWLEVPE